MPLYLPFNRQDLVISPAGLAATYSRTSLAIRPEAGCTDILIQAGVTVAASGMAATDAIAFYLYSSIDGSHFQYPITGIDATITQTSPPSSAYVDSKPAVTNGMQVVSAVLSTKQVFGYLPPYVGLVIANLTGQTLSASAAAHFAYYAMVP
jgi:hypothetical protein